MRVRRQPLRGGAAPTTSLAGRDAARLGLFGDLPRGLHPTVEPVRSLDGRGARATSASRCCPVTCPRAWPGFPGLVELPVTVDWFAKRRKVPVDRTGRGELLAEMAAGAGAGRG